MVLKLIFSGRECFNINDIPPKVNSVVQKILGVDNPYHGKFSDYSISRLQNYTYSKGKFIFDNGAFFTISTNSDEMVQKIVHSIIENRNDIKIGNLIFSSFETHEFEPFEEYDIIRTTSPIRLRTTEKFITVKDPEFLDKKARHKRALYLENIIV